MKSPAQRAFTLIELLVVVAVIALLIAILLPSLSEARERGRRAVCASNLHEIGLAIYTYAHDARGFIPRGPDALNPFDLASANFATNQIWVGPAGAAPGH